MTCMITKQVTDGSGGIAGLLAIIVGRFDGRIHIGFYQCVTRTGGGRLAAIDHGTPYLHYRSSTGILHVPGPCTHHLLVASNRDSPYGVHIHHSHYPLLGVCPRFHPFWHRLVSAGESMRMTQICQEIVQLTVQIHPCTSKLGDPA